MLQRAGRAAFTLLFAAAAAAPALAQSVAPAITGTVRDSAGMPLSNVRVVVTELGREAVTSNRGLFTFRGLGPGTYHLNASLIGYAPSHVVAVLPASGPDVHMTITLRATPLSLSSIQVTASPVGEDPLHGTHATTQLSGRALERNVGSSVGETLRDQPGVAARYAGPATSVPVIRGFTGERILVLQDGERAADLSSTSADHGVSIDPLTASQIEVVRGPASLLYGNNALGGVVNVITHDIPTSVPAHFEGRLSAQGETVNPGGAASASVLFPVSTRFAISARAGARRMEDVRTGGGDELENTFSRSAQGLVGAAYIAGSASLGAVLQLHDFNYGLPFAPDAEEAGIQIEGRRYEARARGEWAPGGSTLIPSIRLEGSVQDYRHDEIEADGEIGTTFRLNTQSLRALARTQNGRLSGAVGLTMLLRQYAPEGEEALTPPSDNNGYGAFLFQEMPFGRSGSDERTSSRIQLGLRYDRYRTETEESERFGPARARTFDHVSGSLGLNVPLGSGVAASLSVARAFRAPTVEELYSNGIHAALGTFDVGDPDLETETNTGIEGVLRIERAHLTGQIAAYVNRVGAYITPVVIGDTIVDEDGSEISLPLVRYEQDDAAMWGFEGQIEGSIASNIVLGAMGDYVRGEFNDSGNLPFMPAARIGASARFDNGRQSLGAEVRHAFEQDEVSENESPTDDYTIVDVTAGYTMRTGARVHIITLRADNLFDVLYREATSRIKDFAPNPGRNVALVYRLIF
jgi:iron complex outermembrane receptor protein